MREAVRMQSRLNRLFQSDVAIKISLLLTVLSIFLPFVYMEIGPMGYRYYGPNVPDIYICGGYIFGKDTSFFTTSGQIEKKIHFGLRQFFIKNNHIVNTTRKIFTNKQITNI
ncbi:MAG: hypothetical protein EBU80_13395, partial [Chitinophagia bacterium]|nr:hypothetical protein [Chitinophagia bacterium]